MARGRDMLRAKIVLFKKKDTSLHVIFLVAQSINSLKIRAFNILGGRTVHIPV
jgi:hypothetical protein